MRLVKINDFVDVRKEILNIHKWQKEEHGNPITLYISPEEDERFDLWY